MCDQTGILPKKIVLPVVSPGGLQIFEATPMKHFEELVSRTEEFYNSYTTEVVLDTVC